MAQRPSRVKNRQLLFQGRGMITRGINLDKLMQILRLDVTLGEYTALKKFGE